MADIKYYMKEREKREQNQNNYKTRIRHHKLVKGYRLVLVLFIIVVVLALILVQNKRRVYTSYDILSSVSREKSVDATDVVLQNAILTYSQDGVHCTNAKGNVNWNQTYEIQDIKLAMCEDVVALADYNGRNIYVQNIEKQLGQITTAMPIKTIAVSATGNVTAVLEDTDVTWINTYNSEGEMIYTGQAHMHDSGYPIAISLSPNGELLAVSYVYVDAGILKTNIVFYNFGPVGTNQSDHLVSVNTYTDLLVPEIHFMNDNTAFAVGDSRLMIYKGDQKPVSEAEHLFDQEVQSVFYNEKYIGLIFMSDKAEYVYKMDVYGVNGAKVDSYYFDVDYRHVLLADDYFVVYNEKECMIMTYGGVKKYSGHFIKTVNLMLPTAAAYKYLLVTDNSIDTIQLR